MTQSPFYDGTKLLSMLDRNKNKPEIFIAVGNRSAGKTVYFNRMLINRFKNKKEKFILLYRYAYELKQVGEKFFGTIGNLFFKNDVLSEKNVGNGQYVSLRLNDVECGYALALNRAENVKKLSHVFNDVTSILFDEFQTETGVYAPNEIQKFVSIHTSVARGNGKMSRYVPVYLVSNDISALNPYFTALKVPKLSDQTKYMRGDGYVLEYAFNPNAAKAQKESLFNRAFLNADYTKMLVTKQALNDNYTFIEKMSGTSMMVCGLKYKRNYFQIRYFNDEQIIYCMKGYDETFKGTYAVLSDEHDSGTILDVGITPITVLMMNSYSNGNVRFDSLEAKEAFKAFISL